MDNKNDTIASSSYGDDIITVDLSNEQFSLDFNSDLWSSASTISVTSSMADDLIYPGLFATGAMGASNISISGGGGSTSPIYTSSSFSNDLDVSGDIKFNGRSLTESLETIEKRLAILVPDPKKLEKYEALQKAYNHYRTLEALCDAPDDDEL